MPKKVTKKVDVRSRADIPEFMKLFKNHPMVFVLVHADFCGHCQTYKEDVWNPLHELPNRNVGLGSIHHDQLENTQFANANIRGYPSVLLVKNGVLTNFKENGEVSNAMNSDDARNSELMENIATDPEAVNSISNIVESEKPPESVEVDESPPLNSDAISMRRNTSKNLKNKILSGSDNTDVVFENVNAPDMSEDVLNSQKPSNNSMNFSPNSNTPLPKAAVGGSLYEALKAAAPAIALTGAAVLIAKRSRRSRRSKRSKRSKRGTRR